MPKHMAVKKVVKVIHGKLRTDVPAGMASAGPPLGSMLGQRGLNIAQFCKDFNNRTAHYIEGVPIPTRATVNPDRSYNMVLFNPPVSFYLKQAAGIQRGSMQGHHETAGWITFKHVYEIAKIKSQDPTLELTELPQICNSVIYSARRMGIEVKRDYDPEEYRQFLEERKVIVEQQLQELRDLKEAKVLRKE